MLRQIEPERIICYNEPFPEMQGNIVFVDYELSSWRYMNDDPYVPSKYAKYICRAEPWPEDCDITVSYTHLTVCGYVQMCELQGEIGRNLHLRDNAYKMLVKSLNR